MKESTPYREPAPREPTLRERTPRGSLPAFVVCFLALLGTFYGCHRESARHPSPPEPDKYVGRLQACASACGIMTMHKYEWSTDTCSCGAQP